MKPTDAQRLMKLLLENDTRNVKYIGRSTIPDYWKDSLIAALAQHYLQALTLWPPSNVNVRSFLALLTDALEMTGRSTRYK